MKNTTQLHTRIINQIAYSMRTEAYILDVMALCECPVAMEFLQRQLDAERDKIAMLQRQAALFAEVGAKKPVINVELVSAELFDKYSFLGCFEEGPDEYLMTEEGFQKALREFATALRLS